MNADRLFLWLLVIFLATNIFSASHNKNAQTNHENTESEVHKTDSGASVKFQRPVVQEQQTTEHADQESPSVNTYEIWSLILTAFIVYITAKYTRAAYLQLEKLNESIIANKDAAEAAQQSAKVAERALTELEVPYVSINEIIPHVLRTYGTQEGPRPNAIVWFEYSLKNHGRSVAEVTSVHTELLVVDSLPIPPDYRGIADVGAFPIGPDSDTGKMRWIANYKLPEAEFLSLLDETKRLVCFGYIRYRDVLGTSWISGFAWRWYPHNNGVYIDGGRRYNYNRKDQEKTSLSE